MKFNRRSLFKTILGGLAVLICPKPRFRGSPISKTGLYLGDQFMKWEWFPYCPTSTTYFIQKGQIWYKPSPNGTWEKRP